MIHLLGNIRMQTPDKVLPKWIPAELVSCTLEDLIDRLTFLDSKFKRLTVKERRHGVPMEMFKGTEHRANTMERKPSLNVSQFLFTPIFWTRLTQYRTPVKILVWPSIQTQ